MEDLVGKDICTEGGRDDRMKVVSDGSREKKKSRVDLQLNDL